MSAIVPRAPPEIRNRSGRLAFTAITARAAVSGARGTFQTTGFFLRIGLRGSW